MTQHVHFDEEAVRAAARRMIENARPNESVPGSVGMQARIMAAMMEHYQLAIVREVNNGADADHLAHAVSSLCSNLYLSVIGSVAGGRETKADLASWMLNNTAKCLADRLNGISDGNSTMIQKSEAGHA